LSGTGPLISDYAAAVTWAGGMLNVHNVLDADFCHSGLAIAVIRAAEPHLSVLGTSGFFE
jgi:hypothetical protein